MIKVHLIDQKDEFKISLQKNREKQPKALLSKQPLRNLV